MKPGTITYFGYGSLVNRDTRPLQETAEPAFLRGWQRVWGHQVVGTDTRMGCCSLSIDPSAGNASSTEGIAGVVVSLPVDDLPVLDRRESGYERLALPASDFHLPPDLDSDVVHVYRSLPDNRHPASLEYRMLQSYVDCVLAGYLRVIGESGLSAFVDSTNGWEGTIENDRGAPRYPRAVSLSRELQERFDQMLQDRQKAK